VTVRRVRFTKTAKLHLQQVKEWWRENRDRPNVLAEDVEDALFIIARLPGVGSPYERSPISGVRRIYARRLDSHLYYTFTDTEVLVRAFWHTSRRSGPRMLR
jgi:plasmid stabilization system protein ParE